LNANYKPKLAVIVIEKFPPQKFFSINNGFRNPPFGTLIDNSIVNSSGFYDFFLVAQLVTQGTAKPTHYRVIYDDTGIEAGVI